MPIEWDPPLTHRRGSARRLGGLDVYYDFDWRTVFQHNRSIFPKGQSLAELVARECPEGKEPTLLLTSRADVDAGIRITDDRYIVIVPITRYLEQAGADAASTFYARLSGTPLTQLPSLSDAVFTDAELRTFLDSHLDRETLEEWAAAAESNRQILAQVAEAESEGLGTRTLVSVLSELESIELAELDALIQRVKEIGGAEGIEQVLKSLTSSTAGREASAAVMADRLEERIRDARAKLAEYANLIADADVSETDVQHFLELNPWIVGLAYVRARPRVEIPRGELDFVLDRYDGFFDVLELKGPRDSIVLETRDGGERPASASSYSLGPILSKALAQAHLYRANLERTHELASQYGLADTRQPRIIVLIGRSTNLSENGREILRQLNLSLHRVEVVPYDVVAQRGEGWLRNIEELLRASAEEAA